MAREFYLDNEAAMDFLAGAKIMMNASDINSDYYGVIKFGYSEVVTNSYYTIWPLAALYPWDTIRNGVAMEVVSSSTNDVDGGSGAQQIYVGGLDSAGNRKEAIITMNGTNAVSLPDNWSFVGRAYVYEGSAAGNITVRTQSGSLPVGYIQSGENQSKQAVWRVPNGYTGVLKVRKIIASNTSSKAGEIELYARIPTSDSVGFREQIIVPFEANGVVLPEDNGLPYIFQEGTEIDWRGILTTGTAATSIFVEFSIINVRNELIR